MLEDLGFRMLSACNGLAALDVYRRHQDEIIAVLMDMNMPGMGSDECARELLNMNPTVKVILASGYNERDAVGQELAGFIQKPYSLTALETLLQGVLKQ